VAIGIPVLAVFVLNERTPGDLLRANADKVLILAAAAAHGAAFVIVLNRYAAGVPAVSMDFRDAPWTPYDADLVVLVYVAAIATLAIWAVSTRSRPRPASSTDT
jgi:hypothetical protein